MTAYAIVETGGKQLRVEPGRFYDVDCIAAKPDTQITLDKVLFIQNDGDVSIGQPFVAGATISATVLSHLRGRKIIVYKMRPKKKTRKKQGHRQELTRVMIDSISLNGSTIGSSRAESALGDESELEADVTTTAFATSELSTQDVEATPVLDIEATSVEPEDSMDQEAEEVQAIAANSTGDA